MNDVLKARLTDQISITLALGVLVGLAVIVLGPMPALGGILGVIVLIAAFTHPEIVILLVLCFVLNLIPHRFNLKINLLIGHFFVSDLLLIWLFLVIVYRVFMDNSFSFLKIPMDIPLIIFFAAVVLGVGTAVFRFGISFKDAQVGAHWLMYYLVFFAVTNLIRTKKQLHRLIRGMFFISLLVASTIIFQTVLGRSVLLMDARILGGEQLIRFRHPGILAIYIAIITLICDIALRRNHQFRLFHSLIVLVLGVVLIMTYSRNLFISGTISIVILIFILRGFQRSWLAGHFLLIACTVTGMAALLIITEREFFILKYYATFIDRISHIFSETIVTYDETILIRWDEIRYAWAHIVKHPITGIGWLNDYRPPFWEGDVTMSFVHNAYVWILLKSGLLGLIPFLWLSIRFLRRGFQHWRDIQDDFLRSVTLGLSLAFLGIMISNLVAPTLVVDWRVAIIGVIIGINELILMNNNDKERYEEG